MSWTRLMLIVFAVLIILLGAGSLWLVNADLSFLKPRVEDYVRNISGREFAIAGAFELDLGARTILVASDISLGNSDWSDAGNMASIEYLRIEVDLFSLVSGPAVINLIEVSDAQVSLEESADGRNNWTFADPAIEGDEVAFVPEVVSIQNVSITYTAPHLQKPLNAHIDWIRQRHRPEDDYLDAEIAATINNRNIQLHTNIGPFQNLLAGREIKYDASGLFGTLSITSSGYIDDIATPDRPAVELRIDSANVDDLTSMLGVADYGEGGLMLDARLVPTNDGLTLSIQGDLAGMRVAASGNASGLQTLVSAQFRIDAAGPHLGRLLTVFGIDHVPDVEFAISGMVTRSETVLLIDELVMDLGRTSLRIDGRIDGFPGLETAALQVGIKGPDLAEYKDLLGLPERVSGPFDLRGSVERTADGSDIVQVAIETPMVNLRIDGPIGDPPDYAGTRFRFSADGKDLATLAASYRGLNTPLAQLIPAEPFAANGTLFVDSDDFRLEDTEAHVGQAELLIAGNLSRNSDRSGSRLSFTAKGADLEDLIADVFNLDIQPAAFEISGNVERLRDELRIEDLRVTGISGSRIRLDADIGWPIATSPRGTFLLEASGPNASTLPFRYAGYDPPQLPFELHARGDWRPGRVIFDSVRTELGDAELSWQGVVDLPPDLSATDLRLSANVPDLSLLGTLDGKSLPPTPFLLDAHFDGNARSYVMDKMQGSVGRTTFSGSVGVEISALRPQVSAQVEFPTLDLRDWLDDDEAEEQSPAGADDGRAIPDYRLPLELLTQFDGSLNLRAREVLMQAVTFTDALVSAELSDGTLRVSELDLVAPSGRLDGTLLVRPADLPGEGGADVQFTFGGKNLQLNLTGETEEDLNAAPVYDLHIALAGQGASTRELAASLNGELQMLSDGGRIRNAGLSLLFGNFGRNLIGSVSPFSKRDPYSNITCVVVMLAASDGIVTTAPSLMMRSRKIELMSRGTIDLTTENINFTINTRTRKGIGISASELVNPYIRVAGTLDSPTLTLDRRGAAISGGAAVVTGGLSILAQAAWNRTAQAMNPCGKALQQARSDPP